MFDTLADDGLIDVISSSQRAEAQAAARRLSAIGVLVDRQNNPYCCLISYYFLFFLGFFFVLYMFPRSLFPGDCL